MDVKVGTPVEYHPFVTDLTPKGLKGKVTLVHEGNPREDSRVGQVDILLTNGKKEDEDGYQSWIHLNVPLGYAAGKSYASPIADAPSGAGHVAPEPDPLPKPPFTTVAPIPRGEPTPPPAPEEKTPAQIYAEQQAAMKR